MPPEVMPRYPIYVPTKGRSEKAQALTIRFLARDRVPFRVVVEPSQLDAYESSGLVDPAQILVLPADGLKLLGARNWIMAHSIAEGHERHWQLDDNIRQIRRVYKSRRIVCAAGPAIAACEDFTDRYENVAISGLNYNMFVPPGSQPRPFLVNQHVYSATLVNNAIEQRWRLIYNDDTDMCLQVLAAGWCTIQFNAFVIEKTRTMQIKGGNTDDLYQGDGRLRMARTLERMWPGVVTTERRFNRPQHVIKAAWKGFDTPLKLKAGVDLAALAEKPNEYGLELREVRPIQSDHMREGLGLPPSDAAPS